MNQRVFILDSTQELKFDNPFWFNLGEDKPELRRVKVSLSEALRSLRLFPDRFIWRAKKEGRTILLSITIQ